MSRQPLQMSPEALFRYQWVAEIETRVHAGETLGQAIAAVRSHERRDERGLERRPSERTLYRWVEAYRRAGLAGLEPMPRPRVEASRVLLPKLLAFLRTAKAGDEELSVPDLIALARNAGLLGATEPICRTTVWRACRRMGLPLRRAHRLEIADTRRFAYPHRMMMGLADGKHFRAGARRLKRVALSFLDDATRYGLGALVGPSESTGLFLGGLYPVLGRYGLLNAVYLDHGPGFISADTQAVLARLGIRLVHGRARYPQGHGLCGAPHNPCYAQPRIIESARGPARGSDWVSGRCSRSPLVGTQHNSDAPSWPDRPERSSR